MSTARAGPAPGALEEARALCERRLREHVAPDRRRLLEAALASAAIVPDFPLPDSIVRLISEEFRFMAAATDDEFNRHCAGPGRYERLLKIATLQRFPAGQFEWELSGMSRSDLIRVAPRELPRVLWFVARRMGGLAPVFFSHLNPRRPQRSLVEVEANRSYHRMAGALELQPQVRGFGACSWFRAPATHRVSPHLAWLSRVFVENGGLVVDAGPDDPETGALVRSATRRALYEAGEFVPRRGLVMWPRDAMIAWAHRHPELAD